MTPEDFRWHLRRHIITKYGNSKKACKYYQCSEALISRVLNGKINPTEKMLEYVGYKRLVTVSYYKGEMK